MFLQIGFLSVGVLLDKRATICEFVSKPLIFENFHVYTHAMPARRHNIFTKPCNHMILGIYRARRSVIIEVSGSPLKEPFKGDLSFAQAPKIVARHGQS